MPYSDFEPGRAELVFEQVYEFPLRDIPAGDDLLYQLAHYLRIIRE